MEFDYAEHWVGCSIFSMRIGMGWVMLQGGLKMLLDPSRTPAGLLNNLPAGNPFVSLWASMAGIPIVYQLVVWGLVLTGIGLIAGAFFRFSAFWASVMNGLFWASSLEGGVMQGLPVAHGWVVDSHVVYIALSWVSGVRCRKNGKVDKHLERKEFVKSRPWLKYFLGRFICFLPCSGLV